MKVSVDIREDQIDGDYGVCDGIVATCERCGHEVEVGGNGLGSVRYAAIKLNQECPKGENNFYDVEWFVTPFTPPPS